MVVVDPRKPVMLIDTSYFIFYRYFAIYNWYKLSQKQTIDVPNVLSNTQFMTKFDKLFEDNLEKLRKKHQVPYTNIVFVKDCIRDHIWRFKHYENYKKSREERLATFNGDIFKYCYGTLLPQLEQRLHVQCCEHNCSEADDIIAVFTRYLHSNYPVNKIVIVTNDNDYLQLITDNVVLVNMKNVDLKERLHYDPEIYLTMKIILGDKSDNIPSVFLKCGEKKAQQMAEDPSVLEEKLSKNEEFKQRFELNKLLIDTRCIPDNIQEEIKSLLELKQED
jgi:5'-3' exonuclease